MPKIISFEDMLPELQFSSGRKDGFMYLHLILWGVVFAIMVVAELSTMQLVSIWFAAGALAAFIGAICEVSFVAQLILFTAISIVLLVFTRPLLKKVTVNKVQPTNADLDIGKTAVVIEEINNTSGTGRVRISGVDWKAVSGDGSVIPSDTVVTVTAVQGAKLTVSCLKEKINQN